MKASWFICKQMLRFIERMFRYSVFPSLVTAEGINKTHDEWHDSSLCLSPTLIFSGWCQCLQTVAVLSNRWKMFHLLYSCPTYRAFRLAFIFPLPHSVIFCQSFHPSTGAPCIPTAVLRTWHTGRVAGTRWHTMLSVSAVLLQRYSSPVLHYYFLLKRGKVENERRYMDMKQRQEAFLKEKWAELTHRL